MVTMYSSFFCLWGFLEKRGVGTPNWLNLQGKASFSGQSSHMGLEGLGWAAGHTPAPRGKVLGSPHCPGKLPRLAYGHLLPFHTVGLLDWKRTALWVHQSLRQHQWVGRSHKNLALNTGTAAPPSHLVNPSDPARGGGAEFTPVTAFCNLP